MNHFLLAPAAIISMIHAPDAVNICKNATSSIVTIQVLTEDGVMTGSGVKLADGTVVTNAHVVEGMVAIRVITGKNVIDINIHDVTVSKTKDLAKINVRGIKGKPLKISTVLPKQGSTVFALGCPMGFPNFISSGIFNYLHTDGVDEFAVFTAQISPGSSGGALLNAKGELIGITTASMRGSQNLNLAVPAKDIIKFLKEK